MPVVNSMELGRELSKTISQINQQIYEVDKAALAMNIMSYQLRDSNGGWVLAPLLAAKAQTLHALTLINQRN